MPAPQQLPTRSDAGRVVGCCTCSIVSSWAGRTGESRRVWISVSPCCAPTGVHDATEGPWRALAQNRPTSSTRRAQRARGIAATLWGHGASLTHHYKGIMQTTASIPDSLSMLTASVMSPCCQNLGCRANFRVDDRGHLRKNQNTTHNLMGIRTLLNPRESMNKRVSRQTHHVPQDFELDAPPPKSAIHRMKLCDPFQRYNSCPCEH